MIPDLGKYADTVLWSYAASLVLLAVLVLASLRRGRKVRAEMDAVERRVAKDG